MTGTIVDVRGVRKTFRGGPLPVVALDGVDLLLARGEFAVVAGRSGSGKTTLLNVVGGLEPPDEGAVEVCGVDVWGVGGDERAALRRSEVAFVFQAFGLLPLLSAAENVEVPLRLAGVDAGSRTARVEELLDQVGLAGRARHRPGELSGGEQQRVAIARALATDPSLIIADEPTGQLDSATGSIIVELLRETARWQGMALLVATHDPAITAGADEVYAMSDGRLHRP
jgi:putative ABC transport system ATP-binding protein